MWVRPADGGCEFDTAQPRQVEVCNEQANPARMCIEDFESGAAIGRGQDVEAVTLENLLGQFEHKRLIFDDKNGSFLGGGRCGRLDDFAARGR